MHTLRNFKLDRVLASDESIRGTGSKGIISMRYYRYISRLLISVVIAVPLILVFCPIVHAKTFILLGKPKSVILDKSCTEKSAMDKIIFVFDAEQGGRTSGWLYGKSISPAKIRLLSGNTYEVTYSIEIHNNSPPSRMELKPIKGGYQAIIHDHIPEDKEIHDKYCFIKELIVNLKPMAGRVNSERYRDRAKNTFAAAILLLEGEDLLTKQMDFRAAEAKGYKALAMLEQLHGKYNEDTLYAAVLISSALMELERFDEALDVIAPYRKSMPKDADLKEFELYLQEEKKEQDKLFSTDSDDDVNDELIEVVGLSEIA
jgi:hypothetical protein